MWIESEIIKEDLENIINDSNIPWSSLDGKNILVTGATGLIGSSVVNALLYYGLNTTRPPFVYALVRNPEKADSVFERQKKECGEQLHFIVADVKDRFELLPQIDYVIHCASQTSSQSFVHEPVETLNTSILGTMNILEFAREKQVKGLVYLSSMEVYGSPKKGTYVSEDDIAGFDPGKIRNCYPISKIACESLCNSYCSEYGVSVKSIRLTQTFGPGVSWQDRRVFAEFARCALEQKDIVLKTAGKTERAYLYTADAVRAILTVMLLGETGKAYNAANEETYCSIAEMADMVCKKLGDGMIKVKYELQDTSRFGYAETLFLDLNTKALRELGWEPKVDLPEMFSRMAATMCADTKSI